MSEPIDEVEDSTAAEQPRGRPGSPVDPVRIVRALRQQWRWIAGVTVFSVILGAVLAKTVAPKTYTSRTVIVWEPAREQSRQELSTLVDSMLIPKNLNEVKRRLKLQVPLDVLALWIQVYFDPNSDVVSVEASTSTAEGAQNLANTVIAVFLELTKQLARDRTEAVLQEERANLDVARATLATAQEVYDTFRRENNVTNVSEETALAIQEAAGLRSQAESARGEAQAEAARARLLEENARHQSAMVVTGQTQTDPNNAALATAAMELQQARARLSDDHPRIAALEAQIAALQSSAGSNIQSSVSTGQNAQLGAMKLSLATSATARAAAVERQQAYAEYAAQARERLQKLSAIEGQAAILLSEVTNAASHVTELEGRIPPLEERLRNERASFRVIAPADKPPHPSSGKGKLFAAVIPGASLMIVLLVTLVLELRGLRIKTAREAAFWSNGPTLGTTQWPQVPDALDDLLDEISDCAQNATGHTLIAPASPGDEGTAERIASELRARMERMTRRAQPQSEARALFGAPEQREERTTLAEIAPATAVVVANPAAQPVTAIQTWNNSSQKKISLRRAARLSDRVILVLTANTLAMHRLSKARTLLGRTHGVGVIVVGIDPSLADLPDRVGDVDAFWYTNDYVDV